MKNLVLSLSAGLCFAGVASAAGPALTGFTGGSGPFAGYHAGTVLPSGDAIGFRFTADVDMFVTDLGLLNDPLDGVMDSAHTVAIWRNSDQAMLASVSVDGSGTNIGGFLYESIGSLMLTAGERYTIAALYAIDDGDGYWSSPSSVSLDGISATNGVFPSAPNLGATYPDSDSANFARIGPNFIWTEIPAPGSLAVFGLIGLASARRRR